MVSMVQNALPLNLCQFNESRAIFNRVYAFIHFLTLATLVYYRAAFFFQRGRGSEYDGIPVLPWLLIFVAELLLSFVWVLLQSFRWKPVTRTVFPERLPEDEKLPAIDVFVCTADPTKEPTINVMNTVISAMGLDYPSDKLHVYVSDDAGASVTLNGMKEAWSFAKFWLPFCSKHGVKTRCPEAYFFEDYDVGGVNQDEFIRDRTKIKEKYDTFKERVLRASESLDARHVKMVSQDHPPIVQVINARNGTDGAAAAVDEEEEGGEDDANMPLLVYVAREKRPANPTHFKAGALNVLFRVSAMISNSPYSLSLDCDMYCNDPSSARQAMCFHLDPSISSSLAFVQFPQKFHNGSLSDIYDSVMRTGMELIFPGMDGAGGPFLCGTNFYMKRKAIYGTELNKGPPQYPAARPGNSLKELRLTFGTSNEFIKSINQIQEPKPSLESEQFDSRVGFLYHSVLEDFFTGFTLHCKGWKSVYCNPARAQFLGTTTTNLNESLFQNSRWFAGMVEVALSKYCPFFYLPAKISLLSRMSYGLVAVWPLCLSPSLWFFALVPQLCLICGIPLYPAVSSPLFLVIAFIFMLSTARNVYDGLSAGGCIVSWCNGERMWMTKSLTSHLYGSFDAIMKTLGVGQTSFTPTNKVIDEQQEKRYHMGIYDFQASNIYLIPVGSAVILNLASLLVGLARVITVGSWNELFAQLFLSAYVVFMSYPMIEAMLLRKDSGRVPPSTTLISAVSALVAVVVGAFLLN
ncbi:Cellulose synthase-like protein [Drosera capensis]